MNDHCPKAAVFALLAVFVATPPTGAAAATPLHAIAAHTSTADVRALALWKDHVWVATQGGLAVHALDGTFLFKLTSLDGLPGNSLRSLRATHDFLLVGGDFGLARVSWSPDSDAPRARIEEHWTERFDPAFALLASGGEEVLQMQSGLHAFAARGTQGRLAWRAAARGSRGLLAGALDGTLVYTPNGASQPSARLGLREPVLDIVAVEPGFLVATGNALHWYQEGRLRPLFSRDNRGRTFAVPATCLEADAGQTPLIGTADGRILRYEDGEVELEAQGLGRRVTAVLEADGGVWFGTADAGVHRQVGDAAAQPLRPAGEVCSNHVTKLTRHGEALVVATFDSGACALVDGTWQRLEGLPSPFVLGLASDGEELWVGTSNGLRRFDAALRPLALLPDAPALLRDMETLATTAIVSLGERDWAVSYLHGVARVTSTPGNYRAELFKTRDKVPHKRTSLAVAPRKRLVIGSETEGVVVFDLKTKKARRFLDPVFLPEAWVVDVATAGEDLWVATCQSGATRLRGEETMTVNHGQGLADDRVIAVAPAKEGGAYVATLSGLSLVALDGSVRMATLTLRLPDPRGSALLVEDGLVWLGTEAGLALLASP